MRVHKLAIFVSHPIQYQAPLFRVISGDKRIESVVYFAGRGATEEAYDSEFGRKIKWDIPLLDGYKHVFLGSKFELPKIILAGKGKADAVLVFGWNSLGTLLVCLAAILSGTPILMRSESPLNQELLKTDFSQNVKRMFLRTLFKFISAFLYIGEENRKFYKYLGVPDAKLFFASYAVDNARFIGEAEVLSVRKNALRKEEGIPAGARVVLFVGKLILKKRPMDLLRAYADLSIEDKALIFVGDGALRLELERYVKEKDLGNVFFFGFKNQTEIGKYYAMSDVFVLPSGAGETWGLVVNEAMCFSLPIMVSDVVGCGFDLVRSGLNGGIFKLGDIGSMTLLLEDILKSGRAHSMGKSSLDIVKKYSFVQDLEGLLSALEWVQK